MREVIELKNLFDGVSSRSGTITRESFMGALAIRAPHLTTESSAMFDALDHETTGKVTFKRFIEVMRPLTSEVDVHRMLNLTEPDKGEGLKAGLSEEQQDDVWSLFNVYGGEKGFLVQADFKNALGSLLSDTEIAAIFEKYGRMIPCCIAGTAAKRIVGTKNPTTPPKQHEPGCKMLETYTLNYAGFMKYFSEAFSCGLKIWHKIL